MDVLADKRLSITTIADGMPTMDYADIKNPLLQDIYLFFLTGFAYWLIGRAGPIRKNIVCKMMNRTPESLMEPPSVHSILMPSRQILRMVQLEMTT